MNPENPSQRIPFAVITVAIAAILYSVQFFAPKNKVWICSDGYVQRPVAISPGLDYKAITLVEVLPTAVTAGYVYTPAGAAPLFEADDYSRARSYETRDPHVLPSDGELWSDYAERAGSTQRFRHNDYVQLLPCKPQ